MPALAPHQAGTKVWRKMEFKAEASRPSPLQMHAAQKRIAQLLAPIASIHAANAESQCDSDEDERDVNVNMDAATRVLQSAL